MGGLIGGGSQKAEAQMSRALSEQQANSSRTAALAQALARDAQTNAETGASGSGRKRRGKQLLTYLNDGEGAATFGG